MVRPASAEAAVAAAAGRTRRSLLHLAVGDHAAADRRQDGRPIFQKIPDALARPRNTRPRLARRRAADVARSWLLFARAQFARLRGGGAARSWRCVSGHRGKFAIAAGDWSLRSEERRVGK